jgi:hypothetical protein
LICTGFVLLLLLLLLSLPSKRFERERPKAEGAYALMIYADFHRAAAAALNMHVNMTYDREPHYCIHNT